MSRPRVYTVKLEATVNFHKAGRHGELDCSHSKGSPFLFSTPFPAGSIPDPGQTVELHAQSSPQHSHLWLALVFTDRSQEDWTFAFKVPSFHKVNTVLFFTI